MNESKWDRLYLVRHGEATSKAEDPERPLTPAGRDAAMRVAQWAAVAGVHVDEIRHSGKLRARQTAEIFAERLDPADGLTEASGLAPNDDVKPLAASLESEPRTVMLVGHLPFLGRLVGQFVAGNADAAVVRFDAAALVALQRENGVWIVECAIQPGWLAR